MVRRWGETESGSLLIREESCWKSHGLGGGGLVAAELLQLVGQGVVAGGAAHLPGMVAAKTIVPVLGVPVPSKYLRGEDSLLSIVQMPKGVPVSTFAIGEAGAANAALTAVAIIAAGDDALADKLEQFRRDQTAAAQAMTLPV